MRVAVLIGHFPVVSETFVLRQLTGLLDLGQDLHIFADWAPGAAEQQIWPDWPRGPVHPEVLRYGLDARTTYIDMPLATGYWAHSVWPLSRKTWLPGADKPLRNGGRVLRALPLFARAFSRSPRLALRVLDRREYGHEALTLAALHRLARLSRVRERFDVLHAHFGWSGHNFRFATELWQAPLLVSFHGGGDLSVPGLDAKAHYRHLFAQARGVTANSEFTRHRLLQLGCPEEKLHLLHEGLDVTAFSFRERSAPQGEPVRLLSVGRLVEMKGHEYAIRAVARVLERRPEVRLDIVGEGNSRADLEALIRELGVGHAVTLHGALPGGDVRRLMDESHAFVLASVKTREGETEGQGLALQEAQACGLPVVATDHGPFREGVVPERSALLCPERDPAALADRLERLLSAPERWPEMGRVGRSHVEERYDARRLNVQLLELYRTIAAAA